MLLYAINFCLLGPFVSSQVAKNACCLRGTNSKNYIADFELEVYMLLQRSGIFTTHFHNLKAIATTHVEYDHIKSWRLSVGGVWEFSWLEPRLKKGV